MTEPKPELQTLLKADDVSLQAQESSDGLVRLNFPGPAVVKIERGADGAVKVSFEAKALIMRPGPDGKLRLNARSWEDARVLMADQELHVVSKDGQIVLTRKQR